MQTDSGVVKMWTDRQQLLPHFWSPYTNLQHDITAFSAVRLNKNAAKFQ